MAGALTKLLREVASTPATRENYSHVTLDGEKKNWYVDYKQWGKFWSGYCDLVSRKEEMHLATRPTETGPLVIRANFRFGREKDEEESDQYVSGILAMVHIIQRLIEDRFEIRDHEGHYFLCVVLTPSAMTEVVEKERRTWCAQVVFHFPNICIHTAEAESFSTQLKANLNASRIRGKFDDDPIDSWDDMICVDGSLTPRLLYGSTAKKGTPRLSFFTVYQLVEADVLSSDYKDVGFDREVNPHGNYTIALEDVFTPTNHDHFQKRYIDESEIKYHGDDRETYLLPLFLSDGYCTVLTRPRSITPADSAASTPTDKRRHQGLDSSSHMAIAETLLRAISPARWSGYSFWMAMGEALYSASGRTEAGLALWTKYTEQYCHERGRGAGSLPGGLPSAGSDRGRGMGYMSSLGSDGGMGEGMGMGGDRRGMGMEPPVAGAGNRPDGKEEKVYREETKRTPNERYKQDRHGCFEAYHDFTIVKCTVKTIAWYARLDDRELYEKWHKSYYGGSLLKSLSIIHTDVAAAFYRVYWLDIVYDPDENRWFEYRAKEHIWYEIKGGVELTRRISCAEEVNNFRHIFDVLRADLAKEIEDCRDSNERTRKDNSMSALSKIITKLGTDSFIRALISVARSYFRVEGFCKNLDTNTNTMGVFNGVIEVDGPIAFHRPGKPEDYITRRITISYRNDYTMSHPKVVELLTWLHQVFPQEDLYIYAMSIFAS